MPQSPHCGTLSRNLHQNHNYLVKDLPMGDKEVILNVNRRRFKCNKCRKIFSEQFKFVGARKTFTHRYAENIVQQVISSNVNNVAENNGLTDEEVNSMIESVAENIMPQVQDLRILGIDEISLVKGQGKFIVVLVDIERGKLIGLVKERKQIVIEKVMKEWGQEVLEKIEEVCIDMTGNYKFLVEKICPNAVITVDRFHVTKILHEELNQAANVPGRKIPSGNFALYSRKENSI